MARDFGCHAADWSRGTRYDDASRAVAAYLARRRFGYRASIVAAALGYRGPSGVSHAIKRIEHASQDLQKKTARIERALD